MTTLSTSELASRLRALGYRVSEASIGQDVLGGLVSPEMPTYATSGRGHRAQWSRPALRRCLYIARLRKIGVEGRLIPLLAYLHDGWGWLHIREDVARFVARGVAIDRRDLRRLGKASSPETLGTLLDSGNPDDRQDWKTAILPARRYIAEMVIFGQVTPGATMRPFTEELLRELGIPQSQSDRDSAESIGERVDARRRELGWSSENIAQWLQTATDADAERGRVITVAQTRGFRPVAIRLGIGRSGNPLTCFGASRTDVQTTLRAAAGRPTAPMVLAEVLSQNIFLGHLLSDSDLWDLTHS